MEIVRYLARWAHLGEGDVRRTLASMRRPFAGAYVFCYYYGKKLLEPGMLGPDRDAFVRRLLTEQVSPSGLYQRRSADVQVQGYHTAQTRSLCE